MKVTPLFPISLGCALVLGLASCNRSNAPEKPEPTATPAPQATAAPAPIVPAATPAQTPVTTPTPSAATVDMTDPSSAALTTKAWQASESNDAESALAYANKAIEIYGGQALEQQAATSTKPAEKEEIFALWALNDVGTCYFIKGQILEKQGKKDDAVEAYRFLAEKLPMAQCHDPQGWFWSPADAARERLQKLGSDAM